MLYTYHPVADLLKASNILKYYKYKLEGEHGSVGSTKSKQPFDQNFYKIRLCKPQTENRNNAH